MTVTNTKLIPGPPGLPLIGNIRDIDPVDSVKSLLLLADKYGKSKLVLSADCKLILS